MENFFTLDGRGQHEVGIYYLISLSPDSRLLGVSREHAGSAGDVPLVFRWLSIAEAPSQPIYPVFLRAALQAIPDTLQHIVNHDDRAADSVPALAVRHAEQA